MGISLSPEHLKRFKDIAVLLMKYGRSDFVRTAGLDEVLQDQEQPIASSPDMLCADLERMGPTFVKLGQVLSTRPDLLPPSVIEALQPLQDKVEPFSFADVERIVTAELGVRMSKAFQSFESTPVGSASLGQVHRAVLRDGREVAVKVQRPGVRAVLADDLDVMEEIAAFMDARTEIGRRYSFGKIVAEFRKSVLNELDYRTEASNLELLRKNLRDFPRLVVPAPVHDYCSPRVLTMDFIRGRKVTEVPPLARTDMDVHELVDEAFRGYLQQIFVDGFFHGDPHPGNVLITTDHRMAFIDLGMVGRLRPQLREKLLRFVLALSVSDSDEAAAMAMRIGEVGENFDEADFRAMTSELVARQQANVAHLDVGRTILKMCHLLSSHDVAVPSELAMLGKTLLNLDEVARRLCPEFNPAESVRRNATALVQRHLVNDLSLVGTVNSALELKEFVQLLPQRVTRILDTLVDGSLTIKVSAGDEMRVMDGLRKIANRIALGLVVSALLLTGALMARVETTSRLFGMPAASSVCFMLAALGGVMLIAKVARRD